MKTPYRPTAADLERIRHDVVAIPDVQRTFLAKEPQLKVPDRVAHQYQIVGSRVTLRVDDSLPANFAGVGLFVPGTEHAGIGRISLGLGCPHRETDPDFTGFMLAFQTAAGARVDFLGINDPTAPSDNHPQFMQLLAAAAEATGTQAPFGSGLGKLDLPDLLATNLKVVHDLTRRLGVTTGLHVAAHVLAQTSRTALSTTAYQSYWTGIVDVGGVLGKFMVTPLSDENHLRPISPGEHHITHEWRARQARGPVEFTLHWLPFIDDKATPLEAMMAKWEERPQPVGHLTFPQRDPASEEAELWNVLTAELGVNPANWVADTSGATAPPSTEFGCARDFAYRLSQEGRGALSPSAYAHVFSGAPISAELAAELRRRRAAKAAVGHVDRAP